MPKPRTSMSSCAATLNAKDRWSSGDFCACSPAANQSRSKTEAVARNWRPRSRSERIISTRDRGRQFLATASVFERDWFAAGEHAQKSPLDHRSFAFNVAAHEDIEVLGFGIFHHVQGVRRHFVRGELSVESLPFRCFVYHANAGEDTREGIIVAGGDRIEFVIMAACARHR